MTVDEIRARVARLAEVGDVDDEGHVAEDELHQDVLRAIAAGAPNAAELAAEALRSLDLDNFPRWYE
jgi:hypothetical protein